MEYCPRACFFHKIDSIALYLVVKSSIKPTSVYRIALYPLLVRCLNVLQKVVFFRKKLKSRVRNRTPETCVFFEKSLSASPIIIYNLCKIEILTENLIRVIYCNMTPSSNIRDVLGLGDSCYSK